MLTRARDRALAWQGFDTAMSKLRGRARLLRPAYPLHRSEPSDMFFVIGSGRSGMTLVRRILMSSPSVHIPPETHVLGGVIAAYRRYAFLPWDELVTLCLGKLAFHPEYEHFDMPLEPVRTQLRNLPRNERSLARMLRAVYQAHAESVGRHRAHVFGEKTPISTEHVDRIYATFPDARFIHVVRDGLDVACSYYSAGLSDLESAARMWTRRTRIARRFCSRHPDRSCTVHYEHLVQDPSSVSRRLANFLGIDHSSVNIDEVTHFDIMGDVKQWAHHANVANPITSRRVGRWEEMLAPQSLRRLERIVGNERRRCGYGDATVAPVAGQIVGSARRESE